MQSIIEIGILEYWNVGRAHKPLSLHISILGFAELKRSAHKLGFIIPCLPAGRHLSTIPSFQMDLSTKQQPNPKLANS
ncbi:MAG: hypothetical protein EHM93_16815 [Bacteroidales bacterium]|nr:MAG: hypothetical protein EHM93_16815 [Bacteroidales bacterium]